MGLNINSRVIAFYLPQFHPVPQNDEWWGKGFTEWTNTAKAKQLFKGHYQPHIPADLGFYDLRVPETRIAQAELAKAYGVEAFCYYHYWFSGKLLLERPFQEVLESGQPNFPFCLCWANHTWSGVWHGCPDRILIEQTYPGLDDHKNHFYYLLKAFTDSRYVTVDGKPIFLVYQPLHLPDPIRVTDLWRELAIKAGLKGLHIVGTVGMAEYHEFIPQKYGMDAAIITALPRKGRWASKRTPIKWLRFKLQEMRKLPLIYSYEHDLPRIYGHFQDVIYYPNIIHSWDNTPRSGSNGIAIIGSSPDKFKIRLNEAVDYLKNRDLDSRLLFIKSWNEWAEGNHLEPDLKYGHGYLQAIKDVITSK